MDVFNKLIAQFNDLFKSMTPGARITTGLLAAVVVVSFGYLFTAQTAGGDAFLLNGQSFTADEMAAMEGAFGKAGLSDYDVEGSRIRISRARQAAHLGALADAGAMPARFGDYLTAAAAGSGPFTSRQQQEEMLKVAKQKELGLVIRSMEGIESAAVHYDIQKKSGLNPTQVVTASVSVKPRGNLQLDDRQVQMIRALVRGAIAHLKPDDVTVIDLNGRSYVGGSGGGAGSAADDPHLARIREYQNVCESRIRSRLAHIPGVLVTANVELDRELLKRETKNTVDPKTVPIFQKTDETTTTSQSVAAGGGRPGLQAQQPNAPAALPAGGGGGGSNSEESRTNSETTNAANHGQTYTELAGLTPKRVSVSIGVPSTYFEKVWELRNPAAEGQPAKKPDQAALTAVQDEELKSIQTAVAQLIPAPTDTAGAPVDKNTLVTVSAFAPVAGPSIVGPSMVDRAVDWLAQSWSGVAMIGLGLFSLLMLKSFVGAIPTAAPPAVVSSTVVADEEGRAEAGGAETPAADKSKQRTLQRKTGAGPSLRDELIDMVREDPDAAANILRAWIGNAT